MASYRPSKIKRSSLCHRRRNLIVEVSTPAGWGNRYQPAGYGCPTARASTIGVTLLESASPCGKGRVLDLWHNHSLAPMASLCGGYKVGFDACHTRIASSLCALQGLPGHRDRAKGFPRNAVAREPVLSRFW
jgi:hypothetical protein